MGNDHLALSQKFILMERKFLALQNFCVQQQDTIGKLAQNFHEACGTQERIIGRVQGVELHVGKAVGAINAQVQAQQIQLLNMERTPPQSMSRCKWSTRKIGRCLFMVPQHMLQPVRPP